MEVLGVGLPELAFIVLIALILLGPKDMVAAGRTLGRMLRKLITSPTWQVMRHTGEELQKLPTKLMREAADRTGAAIPTLPAASRDGGCDTRRHPAAWRPGKSSP